MWTFDIGFIPCSQDAADLGYIKTFCIMTFLQVHVLVYQADS